MKKSFKSYIKLVSTVYKGDLMFKKLCTGISLFVLQIFRFYEFYTIILIYILYTKDKGATALTFDCVTYIWPKQLY